MPATMPLTITRALSATQDVRALINGLEADLSLHYTPEQRHGLQLDELFQPHIHFFVVHLDGAPAGCGGAALFADFAELKRFYVRPELRGRGVAGAILENIKAVTAEAGLNLLRLETGDKQGAALRFYERCGFQVCAAYEPYTSMPADAIATSIFMQARL